VTRLQNELIDGYGRIGRKLRLSVTDRCNMRCIYCMPDNNNEWFEQHNILSYEEIIRLTAVFISLGIEKLRITGGEPTVRYKIETLIGALSNIRGIKSIDMTTNGLLLSDKVKELKQAGLDGVNISLDTFRADRFKAIAGVDGLDRVLTSIKAADKVGLKVKINAVVIRGWNDDEVVDFARFARDTGYTVRFIEFMPLDGTGIWTPDLVFSKREMIQRINKNVKELVPLNNNNSEPATLYSFADSEGTLGFIPSMTEPFCNKCDRLRLTSDGRFLTCLFEDPGYDLKQLLRNRKSDDDAIRKYILQCTKKKPEGIVSIIRTNKLRPALNIMHRIGG
jgi:cyclic pyranopterin phosphate synthase